MARPAPQPATRAARPAHPLLAAAPEQPPAEAKAREVVFSTRLPRELHHRFKVATAVEGVTMTEVLTGLVEGWLADHER